MLTQNAVIHTIQDYAREINEQGVNVSIWGKIPRL